MTAAAVVYFQAYGVVVLRIEADEEPTPRNGPVNNRIRRQFGHAEPDVFGAGPQVPAVQSLGDELPCPSHRFRLGVEEPLA